MNGDWFWWGGRSGENAFQKLYGQYYDRLVRFHHLNNHIWVFGGNEIRPKVGPYVDYFPCHDVVDMLATDVNTDNYAGNDYEDLLALANGKPIALAKVGPLPTPELLKQPPRWAWCTVWGDTVGGRNDRTVSNALLGSDQVATWEELPWVKVKNPTVHFPGPK